MIPTESHKSFVKPLDKSGKHARRITVAYGFDIPFAQRSNQIPYLHVVADVEEMRGGRWMFESGGMLHDLVRTEAPAEIAALCRWHLCDANGIPMHYVANALWWVDMLTGAVTRHDHDPEPVATFAKHIVLGRVPGDPNPADRSAVEALMRGDRTDLTAWLHGRGYGLRVAMGEDCAAAGIVVPDWRPA